MIPIIVFAFLMMAFSVLMIINPQAWSKGIIAFSNKSYFHVFEVVSRLFFAAVFIYYSPQANYPQVFYGIGVLLLLVGCGLLFTPPQKHRQFALWSAVKFINVFRFAGCFSFIFSVFLLYASLFS